MKIAIIGATGFAGSHILKEALDRGHEVTAIQRHKDILPEHKNLKIAEVDANQSEELSKVLSGHDAVISAVRYTTVDGEKLLDAVKNSGAPHFLVNGSYAGYEYQPGKLVLDHPDFPEVHYEASAAGVKFYKNIKQRDDFKWSYLTPSMEFVPEPPKGEYRLGLDHPIFDENNRSWITAGDMAKAVIDEAENPKHIHERVCVGY